MRALPFAAPIALLLAASSLASAQGQTGSTTVNAPPGSGGVTVVAPTPGGGNVTATGCTSVVVNGTPTMVAPGGGPCPTYAPYQPYYPPPPQPVYYEARPRYARDPERTGALIASSIVFGVGGGVAGIVYLADNSSTKCTETYTSTGGYTYDCHKDTGNARTALITYGALVTLTPSIPRFVVGDMGKGLLYTGLRVGSFAAATLINWGDGKDSWTGPFLLGFVTPITLGIVDLATTPHREDLEEKTGITGVAPVALADPKHGAHGALLAMTGRF